MRRIVMITIVIFSLVLFGCQSEDIKEYPKELESSENKSIELPLKVNDYTINIVDQLNYNDPVYVISLNDVPESYFPLFSGYVINKNIVDDNYFYFGESSSNRLVLDQKIASVIYLDKRLKLDEWQKIYLLYTKAYQAYSWFDHTTMPTSDITTLIDKDIYYQVAHQQIDNLDKLTKYLSNLFSKEITQRLISSNRYIEKDGKLYTMLAERGTSLDVGKEHYQLTQNDDGSYYLSIINEKVNYDENIYITGFDKHEFRIANLDDKMVFESFHMIR